MFLEQTRGRAVRTRQRTASAHGRGCGKRFAGLDTTMVVVWSRIIYPDGSSINLDGMMGLDIQGMAGFHDKVDNHYKRVVGFALLTSVFTAGIELSQRHNTSLLTTPTAGQTASSAVGQQLGELGTEVTRKNLSIQPTIKIPTGYGFNVRVNGDILFEAPYAPAEL